MSKIEKQLENILILDENLSNYYNGVHDIEKAMIDDAVEKEDPENPENISKQAEKEIWNYECLL